MKVVYGLATGWAGVNDDTKAGGFEVMQSCEVGDGLEQCTGAVNGLGRVDALNVLFGQNKDMHRCDGVYIGDGQNGIVLVKNFSRNFSGDNAAKNTRHCSSHLPKIGPKIASLPWPLSLLSYFTFYAVWRNTYHSHRHHFPHQFNGPGEGDFKVGGGVPHAQLTRLLFDEDFDNFAKL